MTANIIDFEGWKRRSPLETHDTAIRALIRDINISTDPVLTVNGPTIILHWHTQKGELDVTYLPKSGRVVVDAETADGQIELEECVSMITSNNRWIGYLFDDNFHE